MNIDTILQGAFKVQASDVHLVVSERPVFRVNGDLVRIEGNVLTTEDLEGAVEQIFPTHLRPTLEELRGSDFSYQLGDSARFRCIVFNDRGKLGLSMRVIPVKIPSIDELEFPPVLKDIAMYHRGMVLVAGVTGCGKTTTLAAMVNHVNNQEAKRIVTVEDPIEYMYPLSKSVVSQRELGRDVTNFGDGLRQALRMDPDVILIGEMRDTETIQVSIKAAETGHLVFSTLHTTTAAHTVHRIVSHFPVSEQDLIREQLSMNLRACIAQRLVRRTDRVGRVAALEIVTVNPIVAKMIADNRTADMVGIMKGRDGGMQIFDQALADLFRAGKIDNAEGERNCDDVYAFRRYIRGIASSGEGGGISG